MAADIEFYAFPNTPEQIKALREVGILAGGEEKEERYDQAYWDAFSDSTGYQWFSAVSFAKAGLFEEYEQYVPGPVDALMRVLPLDPAEPRVITPSLSTSIMVTMNRPNRSIYKKSGWGGRGVAKRQHVKRFLQEHEGEILVAVVA